MSDMETATAYQCGYEKGKEEAEKEIAELKAAAELRELHVQYLAEKSDKQQSSIQELAEALADMCVYEKPCSDVQDKYRALAKQHLKGDI